MKESHPKSQLEKEVQDRELNISEDLETFNIHYSKSLPRNPENFPVFCGLGNLGESR